MCQSETIEISWGYEDVLEVAPHLNKEQAINVLHYAKRKHDANEGINWTVLECFADILYPQDKEE